MESTYYTVTATMAPALHLISRQRQYLAEPEHKQRQRHATDFATAQYVATDVFLE